MEQNGNEKQQGSCYSQGDIQLNTPIWVQGWKDGSGQIPSNEQENENPAPVDMNINPEYRSYFKTTTHFAHPEKSYKIRYRRIRLIAKNAT
ncbi:MAG TPA: hypothetical protein V6D48_19785 [Oculatellaceae cyanobacterium]